MSSLQGLKMRWTCGYAKVWASASASGSRAASSVTVSTFPCELSELSNVAGPFHGVPSVLLKLASSPRPFHRFTPFQLLDAAPTLLSEANLTGQSVSAQKVAELLLGGLHDPSVDVRVEALRAARGVLHDGMTSEERDAYGPALVGASFETLPNLPLDVLKHGLEPMIDVASSFPHLFTLSLHFSVPFLVTCIAPPSTLTGHTFSRYPHREMEWDAWCDMSSIAFEVLFSLVIADPMTASHWESGNLVSDIVSALIGRQVASFAAEGESSQEWIEMEDVSVLVPFKLTVKLEDDDETYPVFPEEMLSRFGQIMSELRGRDPADHIESNTVVEAVADQASKLMPRSEWRARYCSLMAIASISEGCYEVGCLVPGISTDSQVMQVQARNVLESALSRCKAANQQGDLPSSSRRASPCSLWLPLLHWTALREPRRKHIVHVPCSSSGRSSTRVCGRGPRYYAVSPR